MPCSVLQKGEPEEVRRQSERCLKAGVDVLSAGCALHLETPIADIRAMVQSVQSSA
ncbi:MAG: hypothetical protein HY895_04020 [Deltaproteobacteria bacterium]|nr:hypothetical protein [Deltaproteobacteria bacterium]